MYTEINQKPHSLASLVEEVVHFHSIRVELFTGEEISKHPLEVRTRRPCAKVRKSQSPTHLLPRSYRAPCSLWKGTVVSRLGVYPKRYQRVPRLHGLHLALENIVHGGST